MPDLTERFFAHPLTILKNYSICPPDTIAGNIGKAADDIDTSALPSNLPNDNQPKSLRYARMMSSSKIGYIELYKDKTQDRMINKEGIDAIRFRCSYKQTDYPASQPVWFLPWQPGSIIRLTIPAAGVNNPDPDIFFTAAINGCSVLVQGTAQNPTIYHGGGDTGRSDHDEAAMFWRQALRKHIADSASAALRGPILAEVNKTDYIKTQGSLTRPVSLQATKGTFGTKIVATPDTKQYGTTPRAIAYQEWLEQELNRKGSFQVQTVSPWGCVMGVRTGGNWAFYLQENATVVCDIVSKKTVVTRCYSRPMALRQIFPGGGGTVNMRQGVPTGIPAM
jgi:hypothetical protein